MIKCGAVAIFAVDHLMTRAADFLDFVIVAFIAILVTLVFRRVIFPLLLIAEPVVAESVAAIMNTEIRGDIDRPEEQYRYDNTNDHE
jgi:hypothetical protein